jgi:hypothetical protein
MNLWKKFLLWKNEYCTIHGIKKTYRYGSRKFVCYICNDERHKKDRAKYAKEQIFEAQLEGYAQEIKDERSKGQL